MVTLRPEAWAKVGQEKVREGERPWSGESKHTEEGASTQEGAQVPVAALQSRAWDGSGWQVLGRPCWGAWA